MKKIISCGLIASGLIIFPGTAMEENPGAADAEQVLQVFRQLREQLALKNEEFNQLKQQLEDITEEKNKEGVTNKDLQRELEDREEKLRAQEEVLCDVLTRYEDMLAQYNNVLVQAGGQNAVPVDQGNPPVPVDQGNPPPLTDHQRKLEERWLKNEIGEKAWAALGGDHFPLANKLLNVIQSYPGKRVEILDLQVDFLKVSVDGKNKGKNHRF